VRLVYIIEILCSVYNGVFFHIPPVVINESVFHYSKYPGFKVGVIDKFIFVSNSFKISILHKIKSEWFNYAVLPLSIVSNFTDVVSYLRLFAVGTAGFAVASAFNGMAAEAGAGGLVGGLGAALILFFGHALNILLSTMGVMVHGIRLNTLEFSGHIGMQWTGRHYRPFRKLSNEEL